MGQSPKGKDEASGSDPEGCCQTQHGPELAEKL